MNVKNKRIEIERQKEEGGRRKEERATRGCVAYKCSVRRVMELERGEAIQREADSDPEAVQYSVSTLQVQAFYYVSGRGARTRH